MTKLQQWAEMSKQLKRLKTQEMELRKELCEDLTDLTGMTNGRLTTKGREDHLKFKIVQSLSYGVDEGVLNALHNNLSDLEKAAVKWKPSLVLAVYKKLDPKCLLQEAVITRMAAPVITVETDDGY